MKSIGMFEAKTHLSALVAEVERGGEVVLTRAGRPVARLVAIAPVDPAEIARRRKAVDELLQLAGRRGKETSNPLGAEGVKNLVESGRR